MISSAAETVDKVRHCNKLHIEIELELGEMKKIEKHIHEIELAVVAIDAIVVDMLMDV